ncbi:hypothetical protein L1987_74490 [Smallanthus sonchifolius]|uniref:Uncharacterized protein n=1 Tax=Smallanthus sonchifolius TaxID=185202 RepID=A0ACB9A3Q4_9ASTR|nr:hypothetical protein L1987_74490 [Smallanthus sonchifolius]
MLRYHFFGPYQKLTLINFYVPVSLLWTLSQSDIDQVSCYYSPNSFEVDLGNHTTMKCWNCPFYEFYSHYSLPQGNPYVEDGLYVTEDCSKCQDSGSYCLYDRTYYYDADYSLKLKFNCIGDPLSKVPDNAKAPYNAESPHNAEAPDIAKAHENDKVIKSSKTYLGLILGNCFLNL